MRSTNGPEAPRLHPQAWVAFTLTGLYSAAEALCAIFVSVYLWRNSHDLRVICAHYTCLYAVTPFVFLLAGWYSQARDRLHVYRAGLVLHAVYYGSLLFLRERSVAYAAPLGALLGVTWGVYWAGANTINYDVTTQGRRELFVGILNTATGVARLAAPPVGGLLITYSSDALEGYHRLFALTVLLYLAGVGLSFVLPPDPGGRPFRIRRALFPGKDQRDWRWVMLASATLSGTFEISTFLLGLLMYMQTSDELRVGSYSSYQALVGIIVSFALGRAMLPESRRRHLWFSSWLLALSGLLFLAPVSGATLMAFGLLRAVALATFGIAHYSLRMEIIANSAEDPAQRIEYLSAWEVPLALGRVVMMLALWGLAARVAESEYGIRIILIALCAARMLTYYFLAQTSPLRRAG